MTIVTVMMRMMCCCSCFCCCYTGIMSVWNTPESIVVFTTNFVQPRHVYCHSAERGCPPGHRRPSVWPHHTSVTAAVVGMWLDLTTTHWQMWLFSSTSTYHSTDLLTARGVAHLVVHGTSGSTSYETNPHVRLETSGGVLSTVDMVVQRRDGPRRLYTRPRWIMTVRV